MPGRMARSPARLAVPNPVGRSLSELCQDTRHRIQSGLAAFSAAEAHGALTGTCPFRSARRMLRRSGTHTHRRVTLSPERNPIQRPFLHDPTWRAPHVILRERATTTILLAVSCRL